MPELAFLYPELWENEIITELIDHSSAGDFAHLIILLLALTVIRLKLQAYLLPNLDILITGKL